MSDEPDGKPIRVFTVDGSRSPYRTKAKDALDVVTAKLGLSSPKETLEFLYSRNSAKEIAKLLGCSYMTVLYLVEAHGIPKRQNGGNDARQGISVRERVAAEDVGKDPIAVREEPVPDPTPVLPSLPVPIVPIVKKEKE